MPRTTPTELRFATAVERDAPLPIHRKVEQTAYSLALYTGRLIRAQAIDNELPSHFSLSWQRPDRPHPSTPPRTRPIFRVEQQFGGAYSVTARFGFTTRDASMSVIHAANLLRYTAEAPPEGMHGWHVGRYTEICQLQWCPAENVRFPGELRAHDVLYGVAHALEQLDRGYPRPAIRH